MRTVKYTGILLLFLGVLVCGIHDAQAQGRCDVIIENALDEDIVAIRFTFSTSGANPAPPR